MKAHAGTWLASLACVLGLASGCGSGDTPPGSDAGTGGTGKGGSTTQSAGGQGGAGGGAPNYQGSLAPTRPAEAFDLPAIRAATLDGLAWVEQSSTLANGVRILDGTWSPGAFTGPTAGGGPLKTIVLASRARLYYPDDATGPLPVVVYAAHLGSLVPKSETPHAQIAKGLRVAVLVHGELPDDGHALGYTDAETPRGLLIDQGMALVVQKNACEVVDLLTANFSFALVRTNLLAITLGQRLLEAAGKSAGPAGLQGGSKEGYATWVASAVDDRIKVAGPGNFQRNDIEGYTAFEENDGCGPNGASDTVDVVAQLTMRDWLTKTDAGKAAAKALLVSSFTDQLLPGFFSLCGDVGMPGRHDGTFFTLGADTHFLDGFTRPHRFERTVEDAAQTDPARLAFLAQALASADPAATLGAWVRVTSAKATDSGAAVSFEGTLAATAGVSHVYAYWNSSPNRQWNDQSQAAWNRVELFASGTSSTYSGGPVTPPSGEEVAWFVEAEQAVDMGGGVTVSRFDASPIRLLRELPKLSCGSVPSISCAP